MITYREMFEIMQTMSDVELDQLVCTMDCDEDVTHADAFQFVGWVENNSTIRRLYAIII